LRFKPRKEKERKGGKREEANNLTIVHRKQNCTGVYFPISFRI
jgi:hypothetical protein